MSLFYIASSRAQPDCGDGHRSDPRSRAPSSAWRIALRPPAASQVPVTRQRISQVRSPLAFSRSAHALARSRPPAADPERMRQLVALAAESGFEFDD